MAVSKKVTKLVCRGRKDLPAEFKNSTCDHSMSDMASSGQKVRVTFDGRLASGDLSQQLENDVNETGQ